MAGSSLERAYRSLKAGDIVPAYYLTGDEDVLKDDLVTAIIDAAVDPSARDFNLDVRAAGDLDGEALYALVETPPMLAERRVVVIRGLDQWRRNAKIWDVLHAFLERPSPTTVLILTHAAGQKPDARVARHAEHVDVAPLKPEQVRRWVARRAQSAGFALEETAAAHLVDAVGGDLSTLAMEIEKLASAAPADGRVDAALVADLVGVRRGETLHDWVDAAVSRDVTRATGLIEPVLAQSGVSAVQMVAALGTALVGLRLARALLDGGSAPARVERQLFAAIRDARPPRLRRWGEEAGRWAAAAGRWTTRAVDEALAATFEADRALKSPGVSDERGMLTTMLLQFARVERAAA
jgi:DNA polymerase-3 subunit delta